MMVRRVLATGLVCALGATCVPAAAAVLPAAGPAAATAPAQSGAVATLVAPRAAAPLHAPGISGSHIVVLQRALIARGFGIPAGATGYFGSQTRAAVAAFQRAQGWSGSGADGIPGPKTLSRLGLSGSGSTAAPAPAVQTISYSRAPAVSASSYKPGASGSHITALQRALIGRGFGIAAGATGYFGPQTQTAVAAFQRSQGWTGSGADGIPGSQTLARLGVGGSRSSGSTPAPSGAMSPGSFIARYGPVARGAAAVTGVPTLVTLGQAALESGWGAGASGNNYFGIKARASDPPGTRQLRTTYEVLSTPNATGFPQIISVTRRSDGRYTYVVKDWFRVYSSAEEAFQAHGMFLRGSRYAAAFQHTGDPYRFAAAIAAAGYATDPSYTTKLHQVMRLIETYGWH